MLFLSSGLWLFLLFVTRAIAEPALTGQIRGRVSIPSKFQWSQSKSKQSSLNTVRIIVDGGKYQGLPTADGYFSISDIPEGPHLLQVVHQTLRFDAVRVEAQKKDDQMKMSAYLSDLEHGKGAQLKYPLGLAPSDTYSYLEKREEFNVLSIFKSPMALMGLFSVGAMFLLPKLQPMLEEEKEKQKA